MSEPANSRLAAYREQQRTDPRHTPEDSVRLRLVALACIELSILAVIAQDVIGPSTALAALGLIPVGFWFSHTHRTKKNVLLKIVLAVGMLIALGAFMSDVQLATSVDDARGMLAGLFLWVQVFHSFDLPRRKDLAYSVVSSLVLMAAAASLATSGLFGWFLIPYIPLAGMWLYLSAQRQAMLRAAPTQLRRANGRPAARASVVGLMVRALVIGLVATIVAFAALPRVEGLQIVAPPFSLSGASPVPNFNGQVVTPEFGAGSASTGADGTFSGAAYPGFGDKIDLRVRGRLSDEVVMEVRASQGALWRAEAYDTWDGTTWTSSDTTTVAVSSGVQPIQIPPPADAVEGPDKTLLQTFYIEVPQPNMVFAAAQPRELYFPADAVAVDSYGSIRSPFTLESGFIYSVVSDLSTATPPRLRMAPDTWDPAYLAQYAQLPSSTPERVTALAHRITDGEKTTYDKVIAVQEWLQNNTEYNLDIGPDPEGVDAVDYFLFDRKQGYCEHIAAAMIVLLRSVGIPARLAVGYGPGERDLFTGFFEVRASDAHAWVEVNYPGVGWMSYDPTFGVPLVEGGAQQTFPGAAIFGKIAGAVINLIPSSMRDAIGSGFSAVARAAQSAARDWPLTIGATALFVLLATAFTRMRRRKRRRSAQREGAAAAFDQVEATFAERGHPRAAAHTPTEYLHDLLRTDDLARSREADLRTITTAFERDQFAPGGAPASATTDALAAAARVEAAAAPGAKKGVTDHF